METIFLVMCENLWTSHGFVANSADEVELVILVEDNDYW